MTNIQHLLRDLRVTELERVSAFLNEMVEADVPPHLSSALIYRCGLVEGRQEERRRQEEKRQESRLRYERKQAAAENPATTIEEVTPNE